MWLQQYKSVCVCPETLMKFSMEDLVEFLQVTLSKDFFFDDDYVIEQLQTSMSELRRAKLELPPPGNAHMLTCGCEKSASWVFSNCYERLDVIGITHTDNRTLEWY